MKLQAEGRGAGGRLAPDPIARGVEDCALVLAAIHGADGRDHSAVTRPFAWPGQRAAPTLRIGYVEDGRALEDRGGEAPAGAEEDEDGRALALEEWARAHMAAYKIPKHVEFVTSLPRSGTTKVNWRALQDAEWKETR